MGIECVTIGNMAEVKTSDLHGAALNLAVAQAEGREVCLMRGGTYGAPDSMWYVAILLDGRKYDPAGEWAQGGPLFDKYRPRIGAIEVLHEVRVIWGGVFGTGYDENSVLPALCRAVVAATVGDTVMVPAELVEVAP